MYLLKNKKIITVFKRINLLSNWNMYAAGHESIQLF